MIYNVQIKVMLLKDLLDPQGKAVQAGLKNLGLNGVNDVRIGKHITLQVDASSKMLPNLLLKKPAKNCS